MPYVNISKPPSSSQKNSNSSANLVAYLEKENEGKELGEREYFFSHEEDIKLPDEVIQALDGNHSGLKNKDAKFFEMSISFSSKEMEHLKILGSDKNTQRQHIQNYTRLVMDVYAKNFDRKVGGRKIEGHDLVYFAKIERNRRYHPNTSNKELADTYKHNFSIKKEISQLGQQNLKRQKGLEAQLIRNSEGTVILPGNKKDGDNTHVHIIVSRRDKSRALSLSPHANSKGSHNILNGKEVKVGFDRDNFVEKVEQLFDTKFSYTRAYGEQYRQRYFAKNTLKNVNRAGSLMREPEHFIQKLARKMIKQVIGKGIGQYLRAMGFGGGEVSSIHQALVSDRKNMMRLASQNLMKELTENGASKFAGVKNPVPISKVITAVVNAHLMLKSREISREGREI